MKALFHLLTLIHLLYHIPEESRPALFFILRANGLILLTVISYWLVKYCFSYEPQDDREHPTPPSMKANKTI